jgi:hypothetical protein
MPGRPTPGMNGIFVQGGRTITMKMHDNDDAFHNKIQAIWMKGLKQA